jgi:HEAT repeat protein
MPRTTPAGGDFEGWVRLLGSDAYRQRARRHLLRAGDPALPALREGLHHADAVVRRVCASILDHLVDEASLPALVAALDDPDPDVLRRALHALACDACKEHECRPADDQFVPRAIELLDHPDPHVRAGAIDALGKVAQRTGDPTSSAARALARAEAGDGNAGLRNMARRRRTTAAAVAPVRG